MELRDGGDPRQGGWYNFYSPATVADQNGDGVPDLLAASGGDTLVLPGDPRRPPGQLVVISGVDGAVLAKLPTPDGHETYMSPVVADIAGRTTVVFGTGGETIAGSLWWIPLESLMRQSYDGVRELTGGTASGFIGPASLADLTADGVLDVVAAAFDGRVVAIDGASGDLLWTRAFRGHQSYASPALGYFDDDAVPDLAMVVLRGTWPRYDEARYVVMNGISGRVLWHRAIGEFAMSGALAVDLSGDGRDEVIFPAQLRSPGVREGRLIVDSVDLTAADPQELMASVGSESPSAPWVGDLDGDGCLDLLVTHSDAIVGYSSTATTARYRLAARVPDRISWGAYLGTRGDGRLSE